MNLNKIGRKLISFALTMCLLISIFAPFAVTEKARAEESSTSISSKELAAKAIQFINDKFKAGEKIDGYTAYLLTEAGEDLSSEKWTYQNTTLKQQIISSVDAIIQENNTVKDAVYSENNAANTSVNAKTIALNLLALSKWQETDRLNKLGDILIKKHTDKGFENSVYSDMWAYLALGEAGKMADLDTTKVKSYILEKQSRTGDTAGAWGETFDAFYPDFLSTAQAIRALTYLPGADSDSEIKSAIDSGLAYLKKFQQPDGSICVTYPYAEDPVVDTSEVIITLKRLGQDPTSWKNSQGLSPVDYMLKNAMNPDGSFGPMKNVMGAAEALSAFLVINGQGSSEVLPPPAPVIQEIHVNVAVVGKNGNLLFGPHSVILTPDNRWGMTALGALDATGLHYVDSDGFVKSINGQANRGMDGWMYKVNGSVPAVKASEKALEDGDEVIWWYSTDFNFEGPSWEDLLKKNTVVSSNTIPQDLKEQNNRLPESLKSGEEALQALEDIEQKLGFKQDDNKAITDIKGSAVVVVGTQQLTDKDNIKVLEQELAENKVSISQEVDKDYGAIIADEGGEIAIVIPSNALNKDKEISIKENDFTVDDSEQSKDFAKLPEGYKWISGIYDLNPAGTTFQTPGTIVMKVALPILAKPENVIFMGYDDKTKQWEAIPAVVDVTKGLVAARVNRLSKYAVALKEIKKAFVDVSETSYAWAKDDIEALAGAGILNGIDGNRFEPGRAVTRAEFVSLLVKALGMESQKAGENSFKDVRQDAWYFDAVSAATENSLINGYGDGTFHPDGTITREEMAAVLTRALKLSGTQQAPNFKDKSEIASWSMAGVSVAIEKGLLKGYEDGTFRPKAPVNRAECAVIIYRMLNL